MPGHVSAIDTSNYEPLTYAADDELYERIETVLGETFQYGPHFRNMRRLRRDVGTDHLMFDVEVDEALWRGASKRVTSCFRPCSTEDCRRTSMTSCSAPISSRFRAGRRT